MAPSTYEDGQLAFKLLGAHLDIPGPYTVEGSSTCYSTGQSLSESPNLLVYPTSAPGSPLPGFQLACSVHTLEVQLSLP